MRTTLVALSLLVAAFALPARAEMVKYTAELKGASEVPPNDSKGSGMVEATYDTAKKTLAYTVTYKDLSGPATAAHFHGPATPDKNAGPVITLREPLTSPTKGEATLSDAQAAELEKGMWYLNVHTAKHPPGEIRGQLMKK